MNLHLGGLKQRDSLREVLLPPRDLSTELVDFLLMSRPLELGNLRSALCISSTLAVRLEVILECLEFLDPIVQSIGNTS